MPTQSELLLAGLAAPWLRRALTLKYGTDHYRRLRRRLVRRRKDREKKEAADEDG